MMNEDVQYCTYCGSINKKNAVECVSCQKNIHMKYRPFYDFLKKHIKDELSGKITDSVFSIIKKFLLSHAYGVAISVSIVASVVATSYSAPGITKVTEQRNAVVENISANEEIEQDFPKLSEDELYELERIAINYDAFVDDLRSSDRYWEDDGYSSVRELYAENNIEGFSYGGVHEMISNPVDMYSFDYDPEAEDNYKNFFSDRYFDEKSVLTGAGCTSDIAKKLAEDGYRTVEGNYVLCETAGEYDFDTHSGSGKMKKLVYRIIMVEHNGQWYMAEDRLIQKTGF